MNARPRLNTIWAIVCTDTDGTEGVPAFMGIDGMMYPLYTTNPKQVEEITELAKRVAEEGKRPCVLVKFTVREDLETFPAQ